MFNILIDELPKSVTIDGREYEIRWWFRAMIKINAVLQDRQYEFSERMAMALNLFYPAVPSDIITAQKELLTFLAGDKPRNRKQEAEAKRRQDEPPVFSFDYDDELIYAAFRQQYNINLNTVEGLHWYEFRAMLHALNECVFSTVKGYRGTELEKIKDSHTRQHYAELKAYWELPKPEAQQSVEDELEAVLMGGGDIAELRRRWENG